jgi:hypothetical protein
MLSVLLYKLSANRIKSNYKTIKSINLMAIQAFHSEAPSQTAICPADVPNKSDPALIARNILSFAYPASSLLAFTDNVLSVDLARLQSNSPKLPHYPKPSNDELLKIAKQNENFYAIVEFTCREVLASNPTPDQIVESLTLLYDACHAEAIHERIDRDTLCKNRIAYLHPLWELDPTALSDNSKIGLLNLYQQLALSYAWLGHYEAEATCLEKILHLFPIPKSRACFEKQLTFNQDFLQWCGRLSKAYCEKASDMKLLLQRFCGCCALAYNVKYSSLMEFSTVADELLQLIEHNVAYPTQAHTPEAIQARIQSVLHDYERQHRGI